MSVRIHTTKNYDVIARHSGERVKGPRGRFHALSLELVDEHIGEAAGERRNNLQSALRTKYSSLQSYIRRRRKGIAFTEVTGGSGEQ
jgi:hypothetical protein